MPGSSWSQGELVVAMEVRGLLLFAALRGGMDMVCGGGEVGAIRTGTQGASSGLALLRATSARPREPVYPTGVAPTSSFRWGSSYAGPCRHTQDEWG